MVEQGAFFDGTSLGDASAAPYSSQEFANWMINVLGRSGQAPAFQRSFIPMSSAGDLAVTGTATPVSVAAGEAFVAGYWYENSGATTLAVSTPVGNPRLDRVVIRIDWAAQTIRLALLAGSTAAIPSPPALTQIFGTTWEVSLAQVYITTGGVITVRDERSGSMGMGPEVLFRDIRDRMLEEFADNFTSTQAAGTAPTGWAVTLVNTGSVVGLATPPSSERILSGATANSTATMCRSGLSTVYPTELAQAPLLFEWRARPAIASADAVTRLEGRLIDSTGNNMLSLGVIGPASAANIVFRCVVGGVTVDFNTGIAIDTTNYHTFGIWVPAAGGPAIALYDGVPVAAVAAASIPATTTDLRAEFFAGNGATATSREMIVDWARLVRGA